MLRQGGRDRCLMKFVGVAFLPLQNSKFTHSHPLPLISCVLSVFNYRALIPVRLPFSLFSVSHRPPTTSGSVSVHSAGTRHTKHTGRGRWFQHTQNSSMRVPVITAPRPRSLFPSKPTRPYESLPFGKAQAKGTLSGLTPRKYMYGEEQQKCISS